MGKLDKYNGVVKKRNHCFIRNFKYRPRKIDSEKSMTFEKTECPTRVLYFISRIFQMKCATDVNDFFFFGEVVGLPLTLIILMFFTLD